MFLEYNDDNVDVSTITVLPSCLVSVVVHTCSLFKMENFESFMCEKTVLLAALYGISQ